MTHESTLPRTTTMSITKAHETMDATIAAGATKLTGAGAVVSVLGGMTASDLGVWIGMAIAVVGLGMNWFYRNRADRRHQEAHEAYMKKMKSVHEIIVKHPEEDE